MYLVIIGNIEILRMCEVQQQSINQSNYQYLYFQCSIKIAMLFCLNAGCHKRKIKRFPEIIS